MTIVRMEISNEKLDQLDFYFISIEYNDKCFSRDLFFFLFFLLRNTGASLWNHKVITICTEQVVDLFFFHEIFGELQSHSGWTGIN